jgi:transposase
MNGDAFLAYVEQVLAPTLIPGDIVVMDNLSAHTASDTPSNPGRGRQAALPATLSPDFNPIEPLFAKLKALLRVSWSGDGCWRHSHFRRLDTASGFVDGLLRLRCHDRSLRRRAHVLLD